MTREEKANKLGQEYFSDESNIWARPNYEAQWVANACVKMAEWERKRLVDTACEWLEDIDFDMEYWNQKNGFCKKQFITAFKQAMEGGAE